MNVAKCITNQGLEKELTVGREYLILGDDEKKYITVVNDQGAYFSYLKKLFKIEDKPDQEPKSIESVANEIGKLVQEKNHAYGNSFAKSGEFLKLLYPDGIKPEQYNDMLLVVRIFDKQMRIANKKGAFGESPYRDVAGYGILGAWVNPEEAEANE